MLTSNVTAHCAHPRPRSNETTKHGVRAETSRQCLSPGGGRFYTRFRPVTYSPRTRKKKRPNLGPNLTVPRTASHPRPRSTEATKHGVRAETSRQCLSPGGGLFYMRFRPVAYSPRTRKKTPQLGPEPNVTAHCAHPQPRSTETTKHGMRAETSRQCLSPGGGLFYMRFRPDACPDQLPPPERPDSHRFQRYRALRLTHGPDRPRPRNTACGQRRVASA